MWAESVVRYYMFWRNGIERNRNKLRNQRSQYDPEVCDKSGF